VQIQRIPRYGLLLSEMLSVTDPEHSEYHQLAAAHKAVVEIAQKVNEHQRDFENQAHVFYLQTCVSGLPRGFVLPQPSRRFLRKANLKAIHPKPRDDIYYLFNDLLMWYGRARVRACVRACVRWVGLCCVALCCIVLHCVAL
jgi:hypothetical protein